MSYASRHPLCVVRQIYLGTKPLSKPPQKGVLGDHANQIHTSAYAIHETPAARFILKKVLLGTMSQQSRASACGAHRLGQRVDVVGAVVAAPVDEERRRARDAARVGARDVLCHSRRILVVAQLVRRSARRRGRARSRVAAQVERRQRRPGGRAARRTSPRSGPARRPPRPPRRPAARCGWTSLSGRWRQT